MCLTCEKAGRGGFKGKPVDSSSAGPQPSASDSNASSSASEIVQTPVSTIVATPDTPQDDAASISVVDDDDDGLEMEDGDGSESPLRKSRPKRSAAANVPVWAYVKRKPRNRQLPVRNETRDPEKRVEAGDSLPEDFPRCATCAKALHTRLNFKSRKYEHCGRSVEWFLGEMSLIADSKCSGVSDIP